MKINEKSIKINGNHTNRERSESSQEHVRKTSKKNQKISLFKMDHLQLRKSPKSHPCVEGYILGIQNKAKNAIQIHRESMT